MRRSCFPWTASQHQMGQLLVGLCAILMVGYPPVFGVLLAAVPDSEEPNHAGAAQFRHATAGYRYTFPYDHGSHDDFQTEWWYYTGHLAARSGRQFGFQLTMFRRGIAAQQARNNPSRWAIRQLYFGHAALSDYRARRFQYAEKVSRAGIGKAGAETGRLHVWIDHWMIQAISPQHDQHRLVASTPEFTFDLIVTPQKPPVVHGQHGISRKGSRPEQASHYYSLTRLQTTGTIVVDGEQLAVTGTSWMDHEFGSGELGQELVGWDWFSIQLDTHTELMFYRLRRADGTEEPASSGTIVLPDGQALHLSSSDLRVDVLDYWRSAASSATYPNRWRLSSSSLDFSLDLVPQLPNQELITRKSTQVTYWEGAVQVSGTFRGLPVSGKGYAELTGYAEPLP